MSRRVSLPGADELFRATGGSSGSAAPADADNGSAAPVTSLSTRVRTTAPARGARRGPTGRERHDEKITVYVSPAELLDLEAARLTLRGTHGLAVDRGRIVREAVAVVLADLEAKGEDSILVRRLRDL
ncbi:MAG: cobyrinic acid a,c-diamide synthase [Frankiaceae bacterium]|nr:cobyrinic acid a,c-diamide synthase [Frankiaceae bacterium]MBV9369866.1 cobyrinic acid a,c-diamide synthase [Frankiales bacterium]